MKNKKLLIIGPSSDGYKRKNIGGTTVSMDLFINFLKRNQVPHKFIKSNYFQNKILNFFFINISVFLNLKKIDIIMGNASGNFIRFISPILIIFSKIFNKKYILRPFGGDLDIQMKSSKIFKKIILFSLNYSDFIFLQTKMLIKQFNPNDKFRIGWFPNCRYSNNLNKNNFFFNRTFVFIGQVKKEKGILEIIQANKILKKYDIQIDIYGPIHENSIKLGNAYKGVIKPKNVTKILKNYSVLVLPTFWNGEGYPGIIIESFSLGIPVITSNFRAIPEMMNDGEEGYLIKNNNHKALIKSVLSFNENNYSNMSIKAIKKYNQMFNSEKIYKNILDTIYQI